MATQYYFMYAGHRYNIGKRFDDRDEAERYIQRVYHGFGVKKKLSNGKWAVGQMVYKKR